MPRINSMREAGIELMFAQYSAAYKWKGNSVLQDDGVDCSGSIVSMLRDLQMIGPKEDYASFQLAEKYPTTTRLREGNLVYYKRGAGIRHVEMIAGFWDGHWWTIGASGGTSETDTREEAEALDARVKLKPMVKGWVKINDPFGD